MKAVYKRLQTLIWFIVITLLLCLLPHIVTASYWLHLFVVILMYVILATALNLLTGVTGLLSIGHAGFYGIGAYCSALLAIHYHLPFPVTFLCAGLLAGLLGALLALPCLRLKSVYLTIVTIGFGQIVYTVIMQWRDLTKGSMGLTGIPYARIFNYEFTSRLSYYYLVLVVAAFTVLIAWILEKSLFGRAMKSVRDDQMAAEVVGVDTKKYKIFAFTLSAVLTGFAGALYAHYLVFISPDTFSNVFSTSILMMIIIGGLGSIPGSIIGAVIVALLPELLKSFSEWQFVIYGVLLIVFMIFMPKGLVQVFSTLISKIRKSFSKTTVSQNEREG